MRVSIHGLLVPALLFPLALTAGCGEREEIRSYNVAKEEKKPLPVAAEPSPETGEATDRMLAAILPTGEQAWFFKLVGPVAVVDKHEAEINKFFESIRMGDDGRAKWDTPEGWKEDGPSGMRAATLWVPAEGKPLELTVMPSGGTVLANVNRWRGQMQLAPVGERELAEDTREVKAGEHTITIVDLRGRFAGSGMMAPFAGGAGGAGQLPPGHPPINQEPGDGNK